MTDLTLTPASPVGLTLTPSGASQFAPAPLGVYLNAQDYGAAADGATDDHAALVEAINTAPVGATLLLPGPGTYALGTKLNINKQIDIIMGGDATIVAKAGLADDVIVVTADNVRMFGVVVNANRGTATGVGSCVDWEGRNGYAERCEFGHSRGQGVAIRGVGQLDAVGCYAHDNFNGVGQGNGFYVDTGGRLRAWRCDANSNGNSGYQILSTATDDCYIDGNAYYNGVRGADIRSANGRIGTLNATGNYNTGLYLDGATGWLIGSVLVELAGSALAAGATVLNGSDGNGVQLVNSASNNRIGNILCRAIPTYALAVSSGSSGNTFGTVSSTAVGGGNSNPGLILSGSAAHNTFGTVAMDTHTVAVHVGEGAEAGNDNNEIGVLMATSCAYGAYWNEYGDNNHVGTIIARNCYTTDTLMLGLVSLDNGVIGNTIDYIDCKTESGTKPKYVVYFTSTCGNDNWVRGGRDRGDYSTGQSLNAGSATGNRYGATPVNITGSRGSNAALASLLTALAGLGIVTDSTS